MSTLSPGSRSTTWLQFSMPRTITRTVGGSNDVRFWFTHSYYGERHGRAHREERARVDGDPRPPRGPQCDGPEERRRPYRGVRRVRSREGCIGGGVLGRGRVVLRGLGPE